jgi:hypothetical protein
MIVSVAVIVPLIFAPLPVPTLKQNIARTDPRIPTLLIWFSFRYWFIIEASRIVGPTGTVLYVLLLCSARDISEIVHRSQEKSSSETVIAVFSSVPSL